MMICNKKYLLTIVFKPLSLINFKNKLNNVKETIVKTNIFLIINLFKQKINMYYFINRFMKKIKIYGNKKTN